MSNGAVAERYAQAIFELGSEQGELSALVEGLGDFAASYESSEELRLALGDPLLSSDQRDQLLSEVAHRVQVPELGVRALLVMAARGRLSAVAETVAVLIRLHDEKKDIVRAHVTTASVMSDDFYRSLTEQLERSTQKKVVLQRDVDSSLVAGAVARVGDAVIDASVRGRLAKLERDVLSALSVEAQ